MKDVFTLSTPISFPKFEENLRATLPDLPRLEAQVSQYMLLNIGGLSFETGASIAEKVGVSEVTVSRLLKRLGYQGMRGLKKELHGESVKREVIESHDQNTQIMSDELVHNMDLEHKALNEIFHQSTMPMWNTLIKTVTDVDEVYVTGFQGVRGMAEDCARRLSMVRNNVRFISAHDSMLSEWLIINGEMGEANSRCLIMIDVVPYAREAKILSKLSSDENCSLIIFTDEMCHWAKQYSEMVIYASTRTGLILESTVAIAAALNLMVNFVAEQCSDNFPERLDRWKEYTKSLKLF